MLSVLLMAALVNFYGESRWEECDDTMLDVRWEEAYEPSLALFFLGSSS